MSKSLDRYEELGGTHDAASPDGCWGNARRAILVLAEQVERLADAADRALGIFETYQQLRLEAGIPMLKLALEDGELPPAIREMLEGIVKGAEALAKAPRPTPIREGKT